MRLSRFFFCVLAIFVTLLNTAGYAFSGDGPLIARLSTLRLKLEHNRMAIGMHLEAVREIASAMTSTLISRLIRATRRRPVCQ